MRHIWLIALGLAVIIIQGCRSTPDSRLLRAEKMSETNPKGALAILDSIEKSDLSESDRHFHDLLTVKATDKAYLPHKSDSLIRETVEWYEKHQGSGHYPEALYYAGRVYSDIGDYPSALANFHTALDLLPQNKDNLSLRGKVLSQTASLLTTLRLYNEAVPLVKEVTKLDSISRDSTNLMYDTQLLGSILLHTENYDDAERKFKEAIILAKQVCAKSEYTYMAYIAASKYKRGDLDSALYYIRPALEGIDSLDSNMALAYASMIYHDSNIPDTTFMYATKLIESENSSNRRMGYRIMLSKDIIDYLDVDSTRIYFDYYWNEIETYLNKNESHAILIQNSFYNYQIHKRERVLAENHIRKLKDSINYILYIVLLLILIIIYLKYRNKSQILKLNQALSSMNALRQDLYGMRPPRISDNMESNSTNPILEFVESSDDIPILREKLREELFLISSNSNKKYIVPQEIIESATYLKLQEYIKSNRIISEDDSFWDDLERIVIKCSPRFKNRLQLLIGGNISAADYHIALLIKCGISPSHMAILIGRTKATISFRRNNLALKVFDKKIDTKTIDNIICSL